MSQDVARLTRDLTHKQEELQSALLPLVGAAPQPGEAESALAARVAELQRAFETQNSQIASLLQGQNFLNEEKRLRDELASGAIDVLLGRAGPQSDDLMLAALLDLSEALDSSSLV